MTAYYGFPKWQVDQVKSVQDLGSLIYSNYWNEKSPPSASFFLIKFIPFGDSNFILCAFFFPSLLYTL
jgi:hypothetical protein